MAPLRLRSGGGGTTLPTLWAALLLVLGGLGLTALRFRDMSPGAPSPGFRLFGEEAVSSARDGGVACSRVAAGADSPFLCSVRRADSSKAWAKLSEVCKQQRLGEHSLFVMRAPVWQALRIAAFGALVVEKDSSSTFPLNTSLAPWASIPAFERKETMLRHKLLLSPTFLFESTFDITLSSHVVCAVARALHHLQRVANGTAPDAGDGLATALLTPGSHALGFALNEKRRQSVSPFWSAVFASGRRRAGSGAALTLCHTGPLRSALEAVRTTGAPPTAAGAAVSTPWPRSTRMGQLCRRQWITPSALQAGLLDFQTLLFTRTPVSRLHDRRGVLSLLPGLRAEEFRSGGELFRGVQRYSRVMINRGFNPPDTHARAGMFLTAFNVVITSGGAMQSVVAPSEDDDASGLFFHTTCEGAVSATVRRDQVHKLPIYEDVVVLTHRHEWNIYHWQAETVGKLAPVLDFVRANPRVKLHVMGLSEGRAAFRKRHMDLLGMAWHDRIIDGNVRAKRVHYADPHGCRFPYAHWIILLREHYRRALGYSNPQLLPRSMRRAAEELEAEVAAGHGDPDGDEVPGSGGSGAAGTGGLLQQGGGGGAVAVGSQPTLSAATAGGGDAERGQGAADAATRPPSGGVGAGESARADGALGPGGQLSAAPPAGVGTEGQPLEDMNSPLGAVKGDLDGDGWPDGGGPLVAAQQQPGDGDGGFLWGSGAAGRLLLSTLNNHAAAAADTPALPLIGGRLLLSAPHFFHLPTDPPHGAVQKVHAAAAAGAGAAAHPKPKPPTSGGKAGGGMGGLASFLQHGHSEQHSGKGKKGAAAANGAAEAAGSSKSAGGGSISGEGKAQPHAADTKQQHPSHHHHADALKRVDHGDAHPQQPQHPKSHGHDAPPAAVAAPPSGHPKHAHGGKGDTEDDAAIRQLKDRHVAKKAATGDAEDGAATAAAAAEKDKHRDGRGARIPPAAAAPAGELTLLGDLPDTTGYRHRFVKVPRSPRPSHSNTPSPSASPRTRSIVLLRRQNDRRIENERDLITRLQALPHTTITEVADWALPDQTVIFHIIANADVIVGVHGAGLTNAIVARPGTCLLEFMPREWFVPCYWRMSGQLGLQHHMFVVEGGKSGPITVPVTRAIGAVRECMARLPPRDEKEEEDDAAALALLQGGAAEGGAAAGAAIGNVSMDGEH